VLSPTIGPYTYNEYLEQVRRFHGHTAPGLVVGGFIVDLALKNLPEGEFFDALCETPACLPDVVRLLTPCTVGNGCLKVVNMQSYGGLKRSDGSISAPFMLTICRLDYLSAGIPCLPR
jgi:hypothetical protein